MKYWWVNHNQTFKEEIEGGYIWSPTKSSNGAFNQSYTNLTLVEVNDIVISYADRSLKAIGVVTKPFKPTAKPLEFGSKGSHWDREGYLVSINWFPLKNPIQPKMFIESIKDLLPTKYSPLHQTGKGNQGIYLAEIGNDLAEFLLNKVILENQADWIAMQDYRKVRYDELIDEAAQTDVLNEPLIETEKEQLIKARVGQGIFRNNVLRIESKCRVTGVSDARFLITSHIKPWRYSNNDERLDGNNGLSLSPHIDKLFDKGWISFSNEGNLLVSSPTIETVLNAWSIQSVNVGPFNEMQKNYLAYHRKEIFRRCFDVTAGFIEKGNQILIARRSANKQLGGYWELPGGKIESGEDAKECLKRELLEELHIEVVVKDFVAKSVYDYETFTVVLHGYRVKYVDGKIKLVDHDRFEWVSADDLKKYKFAPADLPLLAAYSNLAAPFH